MATRKHVYDNQSGEIRERINVSRKWNIQTMHNRIRKIAGGHIMNPCMSVGFLCPDCKKNVRMQYFGGFVRCPACKTETPTEIFEKEHDKEI